jgi:hypothetical protein
MTINKKSIEIEHKIGQELIVDFYIRIFSLELRIDSMIKKYGVIETEDEIKSIDKKARKMIKQMLPNAEV